MSACSFKRQVNKFLLYSALLLWTQACLAIAPYQQASKLAAADLPTQMALVEKKLQVEGFTVIGRHTPAGLPTYATLVVTDSALMETIHTIGGPGIVAAAIRIGVQSDGTVTYINPDYWSRAYLRGQFKAAQAAVKGVQQRLLKALGEGSAFGGDIAEADLANYHYMFGMERFDSANSELSTHASFEDALKSVQANLAKGVGATGQVYEVVMADRKLAVFGVAMNNPSDGEGYWVNKIGAEHIAALPYELFIVDNKVYALYARYRIALAWPSLGMGQFMGIINTPEAIRNTLMRVSAPQTN